MPLPDVSVVLPCAGFGTRFGAPYPKELHSLAPGVTVLDRSLEGVVALADSGLEVRLVVVCRPHKLDTVSYPGATPGSSRSSSCSRTKRSNRDSKGRSGRRCR